MTDIAHHVTLQNLSRFFGAGYDKAIRPVLNKDDAVFVEIDFTYKQVNAGPFSKNPVPYIKQFAGPLLLRSSFGEISRSQKQIYCPAIRLLILKTVSAFM